MGDAMSQLGHQVLSQLELATSGRVFPFPIWISRECATSFFPTPISFFRCVRRPPNIVAPSTLGSRVDRAHGVYDASCRHAQITLFQTIKKVRVRRSNSGVLHVGILSVNWAAAAHSHSLLGLPWLAAHTCYTRWDAFPSVGDTNTSPESPPDTSRHGHILALLWGSRAAGITICPRPFALSLLACEYTIRIRTESSPGLHISLHLVPVPVSRSLLPGLPSCDLSLHILPRPAGHTAASMLFTDLFVRSRHRKG